MSCGPIPGPPAGSTCIDAKRHCGETVLAADEATPLSSAGSFAIVCGDAASPPISSATGSGTSASPGPASPRPPKPSPGSARSSPRTTSAPSGPSASASFKGTDAMVEDAFNARRHPPHPHPPSHLALRRPRPTSAGCWSSPRPRASHHGVVRGPVFCFCGSRPAGLIDSRHPGVVEPAPFGSIMAISPAGSLAPTSSVRGYPGSSRELAHIAMHARLEGSSCSGPRTRASSSPTRCSTTGPRPLRALVPR